MATATKKGKTNPVEFYQVKWTDPSGETHYGVNRQAFGKSRDDKIIRQHLANCKLVVDDAVLPVFHLVPFSVASEVPIGDDEYDKYVEVRHAAAQLHSNKLKGVKIGKLFSVPVADGAAYYVITAVIARTCDIEWRGFGLDRYIDQRFGMGRKGISLQEITPFVGGQDNWREYQEDRHSTSESFYKSLKPGQIVHYNNGFGNYVRCEVVHTAKGNQLKPIALVGSWFKHDIYRVGLDGVVYPAYYAQQISKGEVFRPDFGNIYESPKFSKPKHEKGHPDAINGDLFADEITPSALEPLPLDPPAPTAEQLKQYELWKVVEQAKKALDPPSEEGGTAGAVKRVQKRRDLNTPENAIAEARERLLNALKAIGGAIELPPVLVWNK